MVAMAKVVINHIIPCRDRYFLYIVESVFNTAKICPTQ